PGVPALDLDPAAHAVAVALGVRAAHVVLGDPVDVLQVPVVLERDRPVQRDVPVPRVAVEDRHRSARVLAQVVEALAALVHVHEHAAVLPHVPGGDGVRGAVGGDGADDGRVGLREHLLELVGGGGSCARRGPAGARGGWVAWACPSSYPVRTAALRAATARAVARLISTVSAT